MFTSWWKAATSIFRRNKKPVWQPHHASTCPHNRSPITTATPHRSTPHASRNPTIIITPPAEDEEEEEEDDESEDLSSTDPLPLHPSPFINLTLAPNNHKTTPLTSTSSVNLTFTNHFHHTHTAAAADDDDALPMSNLYYVYHHEPTPDHTYYHYAYYGTWIPVQNLPDPQKMQPKWMYNAETKTYGIVDHRLFGLRGECDCGVGNGNQKCGNTRVTKIGRWRI